MSLRAGSPRARVVAAGLACALRAPGLTGCLDAPKLEDRWTRVDMTGASLAPAQSVTAGSQIPVQVSGDIYYRRIVTGYAVAELRASTSIPSGSLQMAPDADRLRMATDMDRLLATSVSMGREARAVTGWDHLIQHIDFAFTGDVPGTVTDSVGTGPTVGLFLVCYLGSGVKVERNDGSDTVIVTPYPSAPYQILPVGLTVKVTP